MNFLITQNRSRPRPKPACIWMQAGVVNNKPCFKEFHCTQCRFDQAMARVCRNNKTARDRGDHLTGRAASFVSWQDKLNKQPLSRRPCIHHMKGHIDFKTCPKSYHCSDCEFDQFFQDQFKVYARVEPIDFSDVRGFSLPAGYYLGSGHTWVKLEGDGLATIGIDDFAVKLLGRFDTLSAPLMGKPVTRGKAAFTLGRDSNRTAFISPLSGVVTQINSLVEKNPDTITQSPYTTWVLTLHCPDLRNQIRDLMFMDTATAFMDESARHLYGFLEDRTGLKAADGGELVPDIYGSLPHVSWDDLVNRFLS